MKKVKNMTTNFVSNIASSHVFFKIIIRGRHQKRYSVVAITLRYTFALSHNASTLRRKVIASYSYRSRLIEIVIASYTVVIALSQFEPLSLLKVIALQ
jgi:hypothetical protein